MRSAAEMMSKMLRPSHTVSKVARETKIIKLAWYHKIRLMSRTSHFKTTDHDRIIAQPNGKSVPFLFTSGYLIIA